MRKLLFLLLTLIVAACTTDLTIVVRDARTTKSSSGAEISTEGGKLVLASYPVPQGPVTPGGAIYGNYPGPLQLDGAAVFTAMGDGGTGLCWVSDGGPGTWETCLPNPIISPYVIGTTNWGPLTISPADASVVYSAVFTGQTTSGGYTTVQIGLNIPLPGQTAVAGMPSPPDNGSLRIDYELDVTGESTAVGALFKGGWSWSVFSSTVNAMGSSPTQPVAIGTNSGAVPSGWAATIQVTAGQAQIVLTTDSSDSYTAKDTVQWGYTL